MPFISSVRGSYGAQGRFGQSADIRGRLYETVSTFSGQAAIPTDSVFLNLAGQYPIVTYNNTEWMLAAQFGSGNRFGGLRRYLNGAAQSGTDTTAPTQANPATSDWTSSWEVSAHSLGGYKDGGTASGWLNIYDQHPYIASMSARTSSSSTRVWLPPETSQHLIVFADFYRSDSGASSGTRRSLAGSYKNGAWTSDMTASWRENTAAGTSYGLNANLTNADMYISGVNSSSIPYYAYVLEAGNTISTIGFVLFKPRAGLLPTP